MRKRNYLAVYGAVHLNRGWCDECLGYALIIDGYLACCDEAVMVEAKTWKRESIASGIRSKPSAELQREIIEKQDNRCFYCSQRFGKIVTLKNRGKRLSVVWDHMLPFAYLQANPDENWAAACQICNSWKSDRIFQTIEEAQLYLLSKWEQGRAENIYPAVNDCD